MRPKDVVEKTLSRPPPLPSNAPPSPDWLYDLQDIQDKLVYSFQNRHICPSKLRAPLTGYSTYLVQDSLDKLMHFLPQLSDFVPLRTGFYSFRAQTD